MPESYVPSFLVLIISNVAADVLGTVLELLDLKGAAAAKATPSQATILECLTVDVQNELDVCIGLSALFDVNLHIDLPDLYSHAVPVNGQFSGEDAYHIHSGGNGCISRAMWQPSMFVCG